MKKLIMAVKREGYSTSQIYGTMTVGELMTFLEQFDEDMPIYTSHDRGYTYGSVEEYDFREVDSDDEEE